MKKTFKRAFIAGCVAGLLFLVLSVISIVMVTGDGRAPGFTHMMLKLNKLPFQLVGARVSNSMLLVGAAFWGAAIAAPAFLIASLSNRGSKSRAQREAMRHSQEL